MKEWLKDNTYWRLKYNTEKNNREADEKMYMLEIKKYIKTIRELDLEVADLKQKNRSYRKRLKEKQEKIKELSKNEN